MLAILALLLGVSMAQHPPCEYGGGPNSRYMLNLTSVSGYHLEFENGPGGHFYYYTPCTNGEVCYQGNAEFHGNAVQYNPGSNTCNHLLAVDHHEQPTYFFGGASWAFQYEDGQICDSTQEPRRVNVWMLCDENMSEGARIYDVDEPRTCEYSYTIRTPLACVPENSHNANCQWRYYNYQTNTSYYLDLSTQKGMYQHGPESSNGYEMYYSPCENAIPCHQQSGSIQMMSIVENKVTRTCDHYLSEWQDGRVQPLFHDNNDQSQIHWSFHYWLSEKCSDGTQGEQTIRWYCDMDAANATVINATYDGGCRWEMNLASALACPSNEMYHSHNGLKLHRLKYD
mmetsp:Transcript_67455/g.60595  ORF Transcript_67455/g.60595 Transcript_67455/m.60595 type:complete len:341 (+) Transcript_67455:122-1144(+)